MVIKLGIQNFKTIPDDFSLFDNFNTNCNFNSNFSYFKLIFQYLLKIFNLNGSPLLFNFRNLQQFPVSFPVFNFVLVPLLGIVSGRFTSLAYAITKNAPLELTIKVSFLNYGVIY